MLLLPPGHTSYVPKGNTGRTFILVLATVPGLWLSSPARLIAQTQQPAASPTPSPSHKQDQQKNDPNNTPESGRPTGDIGPIAYPTWQTATHNKEEAPRHT